MRVLVCGSRDWELISLIRQELSKLDRGAVIIHGACRGADSIAGIAAQELGLRVREFPADWGRYGRAAGPIRNKQMLDEGKPDVVWAFHENFLKSKGTRNMVDLAMGEKIPVILFGAMEKIDESS